MFTVTYIQQWRVINNDIKDDKMSIMRITFLKTSIIFKTDYIGLFCVRNADFKGISTIYQRYCHIRQSYNWPKVILFSPNLCNERQIVTSCTNDVPPIYVKRAERVANELLKSHNPPEDTIIMSELVSALGILMSFKTRIKDIKAYSSLLLRHGSFIKTALLVKLAGTKACEMLPLLELNTATLRLVANRLEEDQQTIDCESKMYPKRITFLSENLQLSIKDLVPLLTKHSSLLTMEFSRLNLKMQILKNASIKIDDIVKDLWIFNYNEELLTSRAASAQQAGLTLKPWLLRCSKKHFKSMVAKGQETQQILKGNDHMDYLAKRLDCSEDYLKYLFQKNVYLPSTNIMKLDRVLDFLYEKGYTPEEVRMFPKVFCSSVETLQERYNEFVKIQNSVPSLPQISIYQVFKTSTKHRQLQ